MKKLNLHDVQRMLIEQNLKIFTDRDLMVLFGVEKRAAQGFISYNERAAIRGLLALGVSSA